MTRAVSKGYGPGGNGAWSGFARAAGAALVALLLAAGSGQADVKSGQQALRVGQWAEAEKELKAALEVEKGPALLSLGRLYLTTGRYDEALKQATQAALVPATKAQALTLAGEVYREIGKTADAIRMFKAALAANPRELRARVYLGITYHDTGQRQLGAEPEQLAETTLDLFFQEFNANKIDTKKADQLTYTAMAAKYLRTWQDANSTFQAALEVDPTFVLANLEWGDLFLAKYNPTEAAKCYQEVLKVNKAHPRALTGMAGVIVETSYNVPQATKLLDQALQSNPKYVPALNMKARLALDDERFEEGEALLKQALATNPVDLETLTLMATSRYLQDDRPGYEALRLQVFKQNRAFSDFYFQVGELAVRHHRYTDAIALNREAVKLDPKNANALAALGTNLLRLGMGQEPEALKVLERGFEMDAFNIRTFNTLKLYEEVIAKDYQTVKAGTFSFRLPKKDGPLMGRYVGPMMQRAWDLYVKKYGFTPKNPITVELFTERQHYAARTTGLPELGAQGTCFGELITAMSPSSAEASWELVLWHELAHVFHLQLSKNRVARWFTEGLAEYETNIERPYWKREHARDIFLSLQRGELWKISELSAAFTRPTRENGVVIAYQQSSLVIHYLVETYGFPKIVQALKMYGEGKRDTEILPAVTGKTLDQLDTEFRAYLLKKYDHYARGFMFDEEAHGDPAGLKAAAEGKPSDAAAQAAYAAALIIGKKADEAQAQARKALAIDPKHALGRFILATSLLAGKDAKGAQAEYEAMLAQGSDGYEVRMALGRIAIGAGDVDAAARHMGEAKKWDPDQTEPHGLLMQLYEEKERREELLKETESYLDVQEHDHAAARLLVDRYALDKKWADLARVAPRVIAINPTETFVHHMYGLALAAENRPKEAAYELESALVGGVRKPGVVRGLLAKQYLLAGDKVKAKATAQQALKEEPTNADAKEVLQKVN